MSEEQPAVMRPTGSQFIDGVDRFCDRWCERCCCQSRCRQYHERLRYEAAARGEPLLPVEEDESPSGEPPPEWLAFLEEVNRPPTEAEVKAFKREEARVEAILDADPVVSLAKDYSEIVSGVRPGLDPLFERTGDAVLGAAIEVIAWHGVAMGVKVHRACRHLIRTEDSDEDFAREDGDGTAKLVRILIRESREAWSVLMQPGHSIGDGVPARMIARLEELDDAMAARFPNAMAFIRPGLDEQGGP